MDRKIISTLLVASTIIGLSAAAPKLSRLRPLLNPKPQPREK